MYVEMIPFIDVKNFEPEDQAIKLITKQYAKKYKILPLQIYTKVVTIAICNEIDDKLQLRKDLKRILEKKLKKVVMFFRSPKKQIINMIEQVY